MSLIQILNVALIIAIIGVLLYVIEKFIPMQDMVRTVWRIVIGVLLVIWTINVLLGNGSVPSLIR